MADLASRPTDQPQPTEPLSRIVDLTLLFGKSVLHTGLESPLNGVTELANHAIASLTDQSGRAFIPEIHCTGITENAQAASPDYYVQQAGSVVGMLLPVMLIAAGVNQLTGTSAAAEKTAEMIGSRSLASSLRLSAGQGALTGAIYQGVFQPAEADQGSFAKERLGHALTGAVTFGILNGGAVGGRLAVNELGLGESLTTRAFLLKELPANVLANTAAGAFAGMVGAQTNALWTRHEFASQSEIDSAVRPMTLFGGIFGGLSHSLFYFAKPEALTPDQVKQLDLARRSDGQNNDWAKLYLEEFPPAERRDVNELRELLQSGRLALHETRGKNGKLLTWSISQDYPATQPEEPSFWLGCWTVTKRSAQSIGLGRIHFPQVVEALKSEKPGYVGRITEIESTDGLASDSQPVRRAKFYKGLGMKEIDIDYEIPLFQPPGSAEYVPQAELGQGIKGQLLISPFDETAPITGQQAQSMVDRIYQNGYHVRPDDPYIGQRLSLIDRLRPNYLGPIQISTVPAVPPPAVDQRRKQKPKDEVNADPGLR